jgi:DNA-binding NarL/FixJ family response regulator
VSNRGAPAERSADYRILICDDHAVTRTGLRIMAETLDGVSVVGEAENGAEAVQLSTELEPDLVLMDIQMPELDGIEATRRIIAQQPDVTVVVLSVQEDEDAVFQAIRAGASGYLSKASSLDTVQEAIAAVHSGGTYMTPSIAGIAIRSLSRKVDEAGESARLTEITTQREQEILRLLADGLSARKIASKLGISERTVNTHIGHAYRKLGVNNRVDAVLAAMRLGLVDPPG